MKHGVIEACAKCQCRSSSFEFSKLRHSRAPYVEAHVKGDKSGRCRVFVSSIVATSESSYHSVSGGGSWASQIELCKFKFRARSYLVTGSSVTASIFVIVIGHRIRWISFHYDLKLLNTNEYQVESEISFKEVYLILSCSHGTTQCIQGSSNLRISITSSGLDATLERFRYPRRIGMRLRYIWMPRPAYHKKPGCTSSFTGIGSPFSSNAWLMLNVANTDAAVMNAMLNAICLPGHILLNAKNSEYIML